MFKNLAIILLSGYSFTDVAIKMLSGRTGRVACVHQIGDALL